MKSIKWGDYFDEIWCISYTSYKDRKLGLEKEFNRIGMSEYVNWKYSFPNIYDNILFDVTKRMNGCNNCNTVGMFSCTMSHYACIKTSYELGHSHILIMEDDIRFLKNITTIRNYIENIPIDYDIILFDYLFHNEQYYNDSLLDSDNNYYSRFKNLDSCGCYALSRKAMRRLISLYEKGVKPSDKYTSENEIVFDNLNRYFSKIPLACQLTFGISNNVITYGKQSQHNSYKVIGLDYEDYNIEYDNYGYESVIENEKRILSIIVPMHNSEKSIIRTLDSIFSGIESVKCVDVICVDDCSDDGTVSIVNQYKNNHSEFGIEVFPLKEKRNAGYARDYGVRKSKSEYVMFIDSDDEFEFHSIDGILNDIKNYHSDIIKYSSRKFDFNTRLEVNSNLFNLSKINQNEFGVVKFNHSEILELMLRLPSVVWGTAYNRNFILDNRIKSSLTECGNDVAFFIFSLLYAETAVIINKNIVRYYVNGEHTTTSNRIFNLDTERKNLEFIKEIVGEGHKKEMNMIKTFFEYDAIFHFKTCLFINEKRNLGLLEQIENERELLVDVLNSIQ